MSVEPGPDGGGAQQTESYQHEMIYFFKYAVPRAFVFSSNRTKQLHRHHFTLFIASHSKQVLCR